MEALDLVEVTQETFWIVVEVVADRSVVLDMHTQWLRVDTLFLSLHVSLLER